MANLISANQQIKRTQKAAPLIKSERRLHHIKMPDYVTIDASIILDFITRLVSNISYLIPINK